MIAYILNPKRKCRRIDRATRRHRRRSRPGLDAPTALQNKELRSELPLKSRGNLRSATPNLLDRTWRISTSARRSRGMPIRCTSSGHGRDVPVPAVRRAHCPASRRRTHRSPPRRRRGQDGDSRCSGDRHRHCCRSRRRSPIRRESWRGWRDARSCTSMPEGIMPLPVGVSVATSSRSN